MLRYEVPVTTARTFEPIKSSVKSAPGFDCPPEGRTGGGCPHKSPQSHFERGAQNPGKTAGSNSVFTQNTVHYKERKATTPRLRLPYRGCTMADQAYCWAIPQNCCAMLSSQPQMKTQLQNTFWCLACSFSSIQLSALGLYLSRGRPHWSHPSSSRVMPRTQLTTGR